MTEDKLTTLILRLQRRLGLADTDMETDLLLTDELLDAEGELLLYLNREQLPAGMDGKVVELAALFYQQDTVETAPGVKSTSYSEGSVSQSETYQTAEDNRLAADAVLASVARYRLVRVGGGRNADKTDAP